MRLLAAALALTFAHAAVSAERLTLATWNLEWMMTPEVFDGLAPHCLGSDRRAAGDERSIPCDLVKRGRWSAEDLDRIRRFADTVTADVIALQETDGVEAARRIFPDRAFCFTKRRHVQNVGFAVRKDVAFRCNRDVRALGLPENAVRWGADVTIEPGTAHEFRLLAVHLKSACHRDPLTSDRPDCRTLQRQVPALEEWIDARAAAGEAFGVIGDFNRSFDRERETAGDGEGRVVAMWPEIDDGDPPGAELVDPGRGYGAIGCSNGRGKRMPIDYLILGERLARRLVPGSYRPRDYPPGGRWPDHCVISIDLER
jgi:endonuclease/exonuclease/phosphatase family metal-dependent hydrolase